MLGLSEPHTRMLTLNEESLEKKQIDSIVSLIPFLH